MKETNSERQIARFRDSGLMLAGNQILVAMARSGTFDLAFDRISIGGLRVFRVEVLTLAASLLAAGANFLPLFYNLFCLLLNKVTGDGDFKIEVILPYGFAYDSQTSRAFWSKWSRPVGSCLRHMFVHPVQKLTGDSRLTTIAVLLMFAFNAVIHMAMNHVLVGRFDAVLNAFLFGLTAFMSILENHTNQNWQRYPSWVGFVVIFLTAITFRVAAVIFYDYMFPGILF